MQFIMEWSRITKFWQFFDRFSIKFQHIFDIRHSSTTFRWINNPKDFQWNYNSILMEFDGISMVFDSVLMDFQQCFDGVFVPLLFDIKSSDIWCRFHWFSRFILNVLKLFRRRDIYLLNILYDIERSLWKPIQCYMHMTQRPGVISHHRLSLAMLQANA